MKEQVFLIMSKNGRKVAEHDISTINHKELFALIKMQKEDFGRECSIKRVFIDEEV